MICEFEHDSKLPFAAVFAGMAVSCFATWYTARCAWEMLNPEGLDWCGLAAAMVFRAARGSVVVSSLLSGSLALLFRLIRSKNEGSWLGCLVAYGKLVFIMFVAMRLSAVIGVATRALIEQSCEPLAFLGGWRIFQLVNVLALIAFIPTGMWLVEQMQRWMLAARTWLGRGAICGSVVVFCLVCQYFWLLDWDRMLKRRGAKKDVEQQGPYEDFRLTVDEPGEVMV